MKSRICREHHETLRGAIVWEDHLRDVELEYEAGVVFCPPEGDGFNSPRIEAHWELDWYEVRSLIVDGESYRGDAVEVLGEELMRSRSDQEILDGLAWPEEVGP